MKSRVTIVAFVVMAGLATCIAWALGVLEPRYGGLPASAYLRNVIEGDPYRFGGKEDHEKILAVPARVGVPILIRLTQAQDPRWRGWYQRLYPKLPQFIATRLGPPKSSDSLVQRTVLALGYYGPEAGAAVPQLLKIEATTKSQLLQTTAINSLGEIGPAASSAIPMLITHFQSHSVFLSGNAALALGKIDSRGERSGALLVSALEQNYQSSGVLNALSMMATNEPKWIREIWRVTENSLKPGSSQGTALLGPGMWCLQKLNSLDAERVNAICRHSADDDPKIRQAVAGGLAYATASAAVTTPVLLKLIEDTNTAVSTVACISFGSYARSTNVAINLRVTALRVCLSHGCGDDSYHWQLLDAARQLGPAAASAIGELTPWLTNRSERLRGKATEAVAALGPAARSARPQLELLLTDEWGFVRDAAQAALSNITSGAASP